MLKTINELNLDVSWCNHCTKLMPEYAKLASILREENSEIRLGRVNSTVQKYLDEDHKITEYPTLKLFTGDEKQSLKYLGKL